MILLAIETSCDETSAAVIRDGVILSNRVSSQIRLHEEYGGVVPELATREHLRNVPWVVRMALEDAGVTASQLDALAATRGPGLPNALMTGLKFAQSMAYVLKRPFLGIHHHEAHLYSPWIGGTPPQARFSEFQPNVSLIVSGGHTLLVSVPVLLKHHIVGATIDDAAGECFDKIAKLIGLPYPGGPQLDRLARSGRSDAHAFPRPMLKDPGLDLSFSGLKTSVRYFVEKHPECLVEGPARNDLCASVQAAIVDVLVAKLERAVDAQGVRCVTASGGVTCNSALRDALKALCARRRWELRLAEPSLCTDNAAMIGILASQKLASGDAGTGLDVEPEPSWPLASA